MQTPQSKRENSVYRWAKYRFSLCGSEARPDRFPDAKCATYALINKMVGVHGSVEKVPIEADSEACRDACAELVRVLLDV